MIAGPSKDFQRKLDKFMLESEKKANRKRIREIREKGKLNIPPLWQPPRQAPGSFGGSVHAAKAEVGMEVEHASSDYQRKLGRYLEWSEARGVRRGRTAVMEHQRELVNQQLITPFAPGPGWYQVPVNAYCHNRPGGGWHGSTFNTNSRHSTPGAGSGSASARERGTAAVLSTRPWY